MIEQAKEVGVVVLHALNIFAEHIWPILVASGIISALMIKPYKIIKKFFVHHEQVMLITIGTVTFLATNLVYLANTPNVEPWIVQLYAGTIAFMTQPFWKIILKPMIEKVKADWLRAQTLTNDVVTASAPLASPVIVSASEPAVNDFAV